MHGDPPRRPLGWWLKEADARIEGAFDAALKGTGINRRGWQVLSSLAREPMRQDEVTAALGRFDDDETLSHVVSDLKSRGLVNDAGGRLQLTDQGVAVQRELAPKVERVRQQVSSALPQDDYVSLVRLLSRLVEAFE